MRHTLGHKFHIAAKNTFDAGPPGNFAPPDAERVTNRLTALATLKLKQPPCLGFRTTYHGMAEALLMMTKFWKASSESWQAVATRERGIKLSLLKHCVVLDTPVPLTLIWPDQQVLLASLEREGIRTWQVLLHRLEDPEPPLFVQALAALEESTARDLPPSIATQYWLLDTLLAASGVQKHLKPLVRSSQRGRK